MTQDRAHKETKAKAQQAKQVLTSEPMQEQEVPESTLDLTPENVLHLQRTIGNSATARLLQKKASTPAPLEAEDEIRQRAEAAAGYDLSQTAIEPNSPLAASNGVEALTVGDTIHFAAGSYQPETPHGAHVLAHEYGHVVQQGSGQTANIDAPGQYDEMETRAEVFSRRVDQSFGAVLGPTRSLTRPAQPAAQAFDPRYHRESTVEGLADSSFSSDEIGMIYGANWERDLSQAHPAFGSIILAWKECKIAAASGKLDQPNIDKFENAVTTLITMGMSAEGRKSLLGDQTYGGYAFYEHMDNPGKSVDIASKMMNPGGWSLLPAGPPGVPDYVIVSREYIKAELYNAAKSYRKDGMGTGGVGSDTANNFDEMSKRLAGADGRANINPGGEAGKAAGDEAAIQVGQVRKDNPPPASPAATQGAFNAMVADHLGRASHALEDFFAHSNFVDTALDAATGKLDPTKPQELMTGTFGDNDKKHALAHKIRAISDEIETEMPLVNRVAGKTKNNPDPSSVHVGSEAEPTKEEGIKGGIPWGMALKAGLKFLSPALKAGAIGAGVGALVGGVPGAVLGGIGGFIGGFLGMDKTASAKEAIKDVILTPAGVRGLRMVAEKLEDESREKAEPTSHTALAKDQAGHDDDPDGALKTIKFEMALACSKEADRMIIGKMHDVMEAPDAGQADAKLQDIYKLLDSMIALPSKSHPLNGILQEKIDAATKAKEDQQHEYNDAPVPNSDAVPV